jgi:hypothetical protein
MTRRTQGSQRGFTYTLTAAASSMARTAKGGGPTLGGLTFFVCYIRIKR